MPKNKSKDFREVKREKNEFLNTCGSKAKSQAQRGKGRNSPRVKKCILYVIFAIFFDFGSLGTSCYNYLLYRLFTILFQFFTNVFFQCYPLFLCLSFKDIKDVKG